MQKKKQKKIVAHSIDRTQQDALLQKHFALSAIQPCGP
jgi:hypothetical protein